MSYHFNTNNDTICSSWYCECCSKRFYSYSKKYLELNTNIYTDLVCIKRYNLRNNHTRFHNIFMTYLDIINGMNTYLDMNYVCVCVGNGNCQDDIISIHNKIKYPIVKNNDEKFKEFFGEHPQLTKKGYLTFNDLEQLYYYMLSKHNVRKDIYDSGLYIEESEIQYLYRKYNKTYSNIPPPPPNDDNIDNEYINHDSQDGIVYFTDYSYYKTVVLNYLDFIYCDQCVVNKNYIECMSESLCIKSSIVCIMFNMMCDQSLINILYQDKFRTFREVISNKLYEIKNEWIVPCHKWKGTPEYYRLLGVLPPCLEKAGIPEDHYKQRVFSIFSESIISHPMASNGLFNETLLDMEEIGVIL